MATSPKSALPPIPAKRYFGIGEVSELCGVRQHVLRYWEQEFSQLKHVRRRGNRRYYQHHEVMLIRRIRSLLHDQGYTIAGAKNQLEGRHGAEELAVMTTPSSSADLSVLEQAERISEMALPVSEEKQRLLRILAVLRA